MSDLDSRQIAAACAISIRRTFADHVPLYACATLFACITAVVLVRYHLSFPLISALFFLNMIGQASLLVGAIVAFKHLVLMYWQARPENPLTMLCRRMIRSAIYGDRPGNLVHGFVTFMPLMMIFAALKIDIVKIHPFAWDATFMRADQIIGFGTPYWQRLQPVLGYPLLTAIFGFAYAAWFCAMFGCLFWQLSRPRTDPLRSQFLLAFAFAWFLSGFVIATVFSSAGPCFYSHIAPGPDPYAPLLQYLRHTSAHWPIWTLDAQDMLWKSYVTGKGDIQGISAMPSMHLTIAALLALLGWRTNRYMGIGFTAFATTIFLGSIMLGWHYSVDGIAGVALAIGFWFVAGRITAAWAAYRAGPARTAPLLGAAVLE